MTKLIVTLIAIFRMHLTKNISIILVIIKYNFSKTQHDIGNI